MAYYKKPKKLKVNVTQAKKLLYRALISTAGSGSYLSSPTPDICKTRLRSFVTYFSNTTDSSQKVVEYFDRRWPVYAELLESSSSSEFILKFNVYQMNFQLVDYFVIILGFSLTFFGGQKLFDETVLINLIDKKDVLDDALRNPKLLKALMKSLDFYDGLTCTSEDTIGTKKVISHILTKFPDLKKMNFMVKRSRKNGLVPRLMDDDIAAYF